MHPKMFASPPPPPPFQLYNMKHCLQGSPSDAQGKSSDATINPLRELQSAIFCDESSTDRGSNLSVLSGYVVSLTSSTFFCNASPLPPLTLHTPVVLKPLHFRVTHTPTPPLHIICTAYRNKQGMDVLQQSRGNEAANLVRMETKSPIWN